MARGIIQCTIFVLLLNSTILAEKPVNTTNSSVTIPSDKPLDKPTNKTGEHVVVDLRKVVEGGTIDVGPNKNASSSDTTHTGHDRTPDNVSSIKKISGMTTASTTVPSVNKSASAVPVVQPDVDLPAYDVPEKNDGKSSKPRKGAVLDVPSIVTSNATATNKTSIDTKPSVKNTSMTTTSTTTTTTTEKPHKPIYTEAVDEDPNGQIETVQGKEPQVPSIEYVTDKRNHKKADYVVPIVAVILSVPLVAIVISVLYKRGAEWWQHRHYRRMDFLIDGMYNN